MDALIDRKFFINNFHQNYESQNDTAVKLVSDSSSNAFPIFYHQEIIQQQFLEIRNTKIAGLINEITATIMRDEFVDGDISESEKYIQRVETTFEFDCVKEALVKIYTQNYSNSHIATGLLMMISSVPYDKMEPVGPVMALGLLSHKDLEVRDRAIQCFERWNSKKGLDILKNLSCSPKWLQKYVNAVIKYIEEEGTD